MGVVVFDSDVLIGFLARHDAHHEDAVRWMQDALVPGTRRLRGSVTSSEIRGGPRKAGRYEGGDAMVSRCSV